MRVPVCNGRRCGKWGALAAALAIALITCAAALAQPSRPADRQADEPLPRDRDRDRGGPRADDYRGGAGRGDDFPRGDLHEAIDANARTTFARAQYHRLQDALSGQIRLMQYNFEHSAEMADALKAEQQAWEDYVAAR